MVLKRESSKSVQALPSPEDYPKVHKGNLKGFYKYMHKRHNIYIRRFIKKLPPPWTKDRILQEYKFTNVYRKLDRGSQWLIKNIVENDKYPRLQDKIWACIFYRICNNYKTSRKCKIPIRKNFKRKQYGLELEKYKLELEKNQETNVKLWTNAHITLQSNFAQSRIENYMDYMSLLKKNWKSIWKQIKEFRKDDINGWEKTFKLIKQQKGFGGFTAYEVCIDMVYSGVFSDSARDTFANPGPGAEFGILTIYPNKKYISLKDAMRRLTDKQDKYFKKFDINFKGPRLTIQDIEFNLCEFSKYWKITKGVGKARMRFKPITEVK